MLDTRGLVIGELAVRENLLSREQLEDIVSLQEKTKFSQPLGALMLEKQLLSKAQLDSLLRRQKQVIVDYEKTVSVSGLFGRIAIERGHITEHELAAAIRQQLALDGEGKRHKIGQILIHMKAMSIIHFWEIIHAQGLFRCGSCGHGLDAPHIQGSSIYCEKCGKAALTLDEGAAGAA
ncbi:MAG TPA: hypothetical protein VEN81_07415 [Planctomycetota bacterium]|nr:hypothetical protein [Planctomycetota bacterium]